MLYRWKLQREGDREARYKRLSDFASDYRLSKYKAHLCTIDPSRCSAFTGGGTLVAIHETEDGRAVPVMPRPTHYCNHYKDNSTHH